MNEISKDIGELILKIFPREILEKLTTFNLEHFCHTSVLDFIFELPFFSQEFYHSLMWHCGSRLKDKYVNDKYTQSLIHIIEHKSHIVDVNIKNPYRNSLLTYAMWRDKPKLIECLVNHDIIVDKSHLLIMRDHMDKFLPYLDKKGIDLGKFPDLIHYWDEYLIDEKTIKMALKNNLNYNSIINNQYCKSKLLVMLINSMELKKQVVPFFKFCNVMNHLPLYDRNIIRSIIPFITRDIIPLNSKVS